MNRRLEKIASTLQRAISEVLTRRISDPRIEGLVSVTRVEVAPDLSEAFIYISVLPQRYEKRTIAGLASAAGYIQSLVRKAVVLKQVPRLEFRLDRSLKKQAQVLRALDEVRPDDPSDEAADALEESDPPSDNESDQQEPSA